MSTVPQEIESLYSKEDLFYLFIIPVVVNDGPMPYPFLDMDIYGKDKEPWNIFDKRARGSFWIFTRLKRKDRSTFRMERTAGSGVWRAWGGGPGIIRVLDKQGQVLGVQRKYTFISKTGQPEDRENGHWMMTEYSLNNPDFNDRVLCEIKNTDPAGSYSGLNQVQDASSDEEEDSDDYSDWGSDLSLYLKPHHEETMPNHANGTSDMRSNDPESSPNQQDVTVLDPKIETQMLTAAIPVKATEIACGSATKGNSDEPNSKKTQDTNAEAQHLQLH